MLGTLRGDYSVGTLLITMPGGKTAKAVLAFAKDDCCGKGLCGTRKCPGHCKEAAASEEQVPQIKNSQ